MFLPLFTDYRYQDSQWPAIYRIECKLAESLRNHWLELTGLSSYRLIDRLTGLVTKDEPQSGSEAIDPSLLAQFLGREHGNIAHLIDRMNAADIKSNPVRERDLLDAALLPALPESNLLCARRMRALADRYPQILTTASPLL